MLEEKECTTRGHHVMLEEKECTTRGHRVMLDLTRLPPRDSIQDGRWTMKPFGLSIVQPIYLIIFPC